MCSTATLIRNSCCFLEEKYYYRNTEGDRVGGCGRLRSSDGGSRCEGFLCKVHKPWQEFKTYLSFCISCLTWVFGSFLSDHMQASLATSSASRTKSYFRTASFFPGSHPYPRRPRHQIVLVVPPELGEFYCNVKRRKLMQELTLDGRIVEMSTLFPLDLVTIASGNNSLASLL